MGGVAWPRPVDKHFLEEIILRIQKLLARLPLRYEISPDAKRHWEERHAALPSTEHVKRLDTIGLRLLPLVALTNDQEVIDKETVESGAPFSIMS
jgi:hypothetical protein